jgi:hypothetical protein
MSKSLRKALRTPIHGKVLEAFDCVGILLHVVQLQRQLSTRGRCYDHNFLRFSPIFGKIGVFLKNQY